MMFRITKFAAAGVIAALSLGLVGCYEEVNPTTPPQANSAPPPKEGPITSTGSQGGGSALGGAKRTATKIADDAQRKSQQIADHADDPAPTKPPDQ